MIWFVTACALLLGAGCTSRPDSTAFVEHYGELHRSGDVAGLLALHTADAEFLIVGQEPIRGTAALRDLFEWDAVLGSELFMEAISAHGDTIFVDSLAERNKWFEAMGLHEVRYRPGMKIVLRDGRILGTYPAAFDDESQRRVGEGFQRLVHWLAANRPETLESLLPGGSFKYDAASARLWLKALAEWRDAEQRSD